MSNVSDRPPISLRALLRRPFRAALAIATLVLLCRCESADVAARHSGLAPADRSETYSSTAHQPRAGLGTDWGPRVRSPVGATDFARTSSQPAATLTIRYTDDDGLPASAWRTRQPFDLGSLASVSIRSGWRKLKAFHAGGTPVVVGEHGDHYSIRVTNRTRHRIEVVLSVDGLDVLDGTSASFRKRGYVIAPYGSVEVAGFRRSLESVAAFRFGTVSSSYAAQTTGSARNVGVIGAAAFTERSSRGDWPHRRRADPFPAERGSGDFAQPPAGAW